MLPVPDRLDQTLTEPCREASAPTASPIIDAGMRILARDGFQRRTVRNVADGAGTNPARINYSFGGKQGLLPAISGTPDRQRYTRQADRYRNTAKIWPTASCASTVN